MAPQGTWLPGYLVRRTDYSVPKHQYHADSRNLARLIVPFFSLGAGRGVARPRAFGRDPYVTYRILCTIECYCGRVLRNISQHSPGDPTMEDETGKVIMANINCTSNQFEYTSKTPTKAKHF